MENNTITPKPEPQPQPVAPMPVFGSAVSAPTVTPETPASPTLSTSAMPAMPAQPTPATPTAPAASVPTATEAPAQTTPVAQAVANPAAKAPVADTPVATAQATASANTVANSNTAAPIQPATPAVTPITTPKPNVTPATNISPTSTPADTTIAPAANPAGATTAPVASATATSAVAESASAASAPGAAPATAVNTASDIANNNATTASTQPPINKGRLIALIAIIAGLLVAGIIAAVVIVLATRQPSPAAIAETALTKLESGEDAPSSIAGSVELVSNDDVIASASVVLENNNLFFSYDGVSDILEGYLGLAAVADQESVSSLVLISSLLQFAESTWWQVPVEDFSLGTEYRAHPFLMLATANDNEYHLKIDGNKFTDFLKALDVDFGTGEVTNCIDGPAGTNCGSSDSAGLSLFGITSMPTASQVREAVTSIDILAKIDTQNRITSLYTTLGEDDFTVDVKLNLVYAGASLSPAEYTPIAELVNQFVQAIGY